VTEHQRWNRVGDVLQAVPRVASPDVLGAAAAASSSCDTPPTPRKASGRRDPRERDYVVAVLECYASSPDTPTVTSRHDRRCAQEWFRRGVPLEVVKSALILASARRLMRNGEPLPRVRAVAYYRPVVEELLETPCDPSYIAYLSRKLEPHVAAKRARRTAT
jgi:hypothetical protein